MKKIICLLLIRACSFAMFSCKKKGGGSDVSAISKIVNESSATEIVTKVDYVPVDDEALTGIYTTSVDRASGKSKFHFEYSRYAKVEELHSGYIKTVIGTVWYDANGDVSHDEGETWEPNTVTAYLPYSLDISEARFASFTISEDGTDMTAEVTAAESKRAFGIEIAAEGNISLEVVTDGTYLYEVTITYTAKDTGALVQVTTSYDYGKVEFDFGIDVGAGSGAEEGTEDGTGAEE